MRGQRRLSVGVIFGGRSVEHDVSIVTAHQVMEQISPTHDVVPIYVTKEGRWLSAAGLNDLEVYRSRRWDEVGEEAFIPPIAGYGGVMVVGGRLRGTKRVPLDVVVPAIHGTFGEDGTLQGLLELASIPYTGSGVVGSALGMDKIAMKAAFLAAGLPVVPDVLVDAAKLDSTRDEIVTSVEEAIGYPAFVKPSRLGSSVGIGRADDRDALLNALEVARRYDTSLLVERAMVGCSEINCSVLGGPGFEERVSVCEQPVSWDEFLTFSDKYLRGGKSAKGAGGMADQERRIPAPISPELTMQVQENALTAFRAIHASGVARIDSFVDEHTGESWVMEINTVPGSFAYYLWEESGLEFSKLMDTLIDIALESQRSKERLMFSFDSEILDAKRGEKTGG